LNRALYPRSKRGIRRWYERTILPFILRIAPEKLTSHAFGEHMEYLNEDAIERIEKELSSRIIELYDINTECLLYDITNFYTFIQEYEGNELPKKGKSKTKRFDLNQINLALLVTKDGGIPLMHQTYEGNMHDAKKFPEIISKLADRFVMFSKNVEGAEKEGNITLDYAVNKTVYNEKLKWFRKTIVFTNNHEWSTAQIIRVYRGTAKIGDDFKRMKSPIMISLEPVYHWTDQKIRVHAFCCVLALMLLLLLKRKLQRADVKFSLERMIEELSDVQLSVIKFYDVDKRLCVLNELNEEQKAMFAVRDLMRYKKWSSTALH
jgi:transposase